jgi:hypothetical protein
MTIAERVRAVAMLVSRLSLRQLLLTLSYSLSRFHYFIHVICLGSLQHGWFFSVLSWNWHVTITEKKTHMVSFRYPPKAKVTCQYQGLRSLQFWRDRYELVMSTSRQTNGGHGFLMSPQQVRYHLKVEQLFATLPRRGLVLTYKHPVLRLAWARIHLIFTKA